MGTVIASIGLFLFLGNCENMTRKEGAEEIVESRVDGYGTATECRCETGYWANNRVEKARPRSRPLRQLARISHTACTLRRLAASRMRTRDAKSISGHSDERSALADGRRRATLRAG